MRSYRRPSRLDSRPYCRRTRPLVDAGLAADGAAGAEANESLAAAKARPIDRRAGGRRWRCAHERGPAGVHGASGHRHDSRADRARAHRPGIGGPPAPAAGRCAAHDSGVREAGDDDHRAAVEVGGDGATQEGRSSIGRGFLASRRPWRSSASSAVALAPAVTSCARARGPRAHAQRRLLLDRASVAAPRRAAPSGPRVPVNKEGSAESEKLAGTPRLTLLRTRSLRRDTLYDSLLARAGVTTLPAYDMWIDDIYVDSSRVGCAR